MFLKWILLLFIGFSAGGVIAAGIFAFLAIIGVFPRIIGKTGTKRHILLYETIIIIGGTFGNLVDIYEFSMPFGDALTGIPTLGNLVLGFFAFGVGIFVGCLVMSLAETLKALPVISRRVHLSVGLQYMILSIALGKLVGSLIYFINGFGG